MKTRIIFITTLMCFLAGFNAKAQNLSNIDVRQQDTIIYVSYDLQQKSDIYLYVSLNDGNSFLGPMHYVSGDVGHNVHPGEKKIVFWYAVSEIGYISNPNVRFKIVAKSSKDEYLKKTNLQYATVNGERPFEITKTEVTVSQYAQFVENTNYKTTAELSGFSYVWNGNKWEKKKGVSWKTNNYGLPIIDKQHKPVTNLSYKDVVAFCEWAGCRLPSVEEWTAAAKGGESYKFSGSQKAGDVAWSFVNASGKPRNVASKKANAFGLFDMCGNVAEWTSDMSGNEYIFCGGNCYSDLNNCTVDSKSHSVATGSNSLVGFRAVKASSKDKSLPVINIEGKSNSEPSFTELVSEKKKTFITLNWAYTNSPQNSIGVTFGQYKKFGWFASVMSGFNYKGMSAVAECNATGDVGNFYPLYSGKMSRNRLSIMGGFILRLCPGFYGRAGLGYGLRNLNYETVDGEWIRAKNYSTHGVDMSLGLHGEIGKVVLSGDLVTTNFKTLEFKLGVGFIISGKE